MQRQIRGAAFAVALGMFLATAGWGQTMDGRLSESAAVPLDFLQWIDRDVAWLGEALAAEGVAPQVKVAGPVLETSSVAALQAVNRIRSFAYLAAPGLRPPYFDLTLTGQGGETFRCVTLFPTSIVPGIGAMDFTKESFSAAEADPTILDLCRVPAAISGEYRNLDRQAFRERYFDARGDLRSEFAALNNDPAFVATAFDHGFFVEQGDLTGRVRLAS